MRSGRKKARGSKPRFEVWLRERGLRWEAERWRYHAALEQERHSPPPREPETEQGADAMIALRMRANGHSRGAVEETIRTCAPTIRDSQTGRNWQRYAERTANYAFGMAGDRDLMRNERYRELWRKVEGGEYDKGRIGLKLR